jgi:hypothetical protein
VTFLSPLSSAIRAFSDSVFYCAYNFVSSIIHVIGLLACEFLLGLKFYNLSDSSEYVASREFRILSFFFFSRLPISFPSTTEELQRRHHSASEQNQIQKSSFMCTFSALHTQT